MDFCIRPRIIIGTQKGTIILTIPHIYICIYIYIYTQEEQVADSLACLLW